ncbi:MAG TPA: AAA family ATPase, partial [Stellaceae bacterium]|nr:AAA family ATPase [Stellaceae bacterium]
MGLINDAARRQLAWYVRSCLTSPAAHFLEAAAISQLDVLRGETDDADDYFTETRVTNRRCKLRELHSLLCGLGAAPRGDQQFERNIAFVRKEFGLDAIDTEILLLLLRYESNPAIEAFVDRVAANAARAAALAGGGEAEIEQAISRVLPLLGIAPQFADAHGHEFGPALVNCGVDLAALAERLTRPGAPAGWSLCVHGLPGTGKSQFARHLAARLGLEVMQQRASDLLSMWVGGSEKAIAAAFAAARSQRAMLIFDEADSLLSDRREASHSWEVTQ